MQRRVDREPIAIGLALTFGPPLLKAICALGKQIHRTVQAHGNNEKDLIDLDAHVSEVIGYLQYLPDKSQRTAEFQQPLENLQVCLTECLEFLQRFNDIPFFGQIIRSHHYKRQFEDLKSRLNSCKERLQFAISLHNFAEDARNRRRTTNEPHAAEQRKTTPTGQARDQQIIRPNNHFMKQSPNHISHQKRHHLNHLNNEVKALSNHQRNHHGSGGECHH